MDTKQEEILKIEEDANRLVGNLKELYEKVGSYQSAREELVKTNSNLTSFIKETQELSKESHRIIEIINQIGSSKIFERLDIISKTQAKLEARGKINFIITIGGISVIVVLQILFFILK